MTVDKQPRPSHPSAQRLTLQAEGAFICILCVATYAQTGMGWLWFALLFLAPDLAMLGYLAGKRVGALCYNLAHSYLLPLLMIGTLTVWPDQYTIGLALIWCAHIGFDRAIGYGLKYGRGFKDNHLQRL